MRTAPISTSGFALKQGTNGLSKNSSEEHAKMRVNSNYSGLTLQKTHNPSFGWFVLDDLYYYGNRKLNDSREAERTEQKDAVNKKVTDDVTLLAKKLKIPRAAAQERYNEYLKIGGIEPNRNGNEVGLNKVVGYCEEKLDLIKDVVAPILIKQDVIKKGKEQPNDLSIPNGVILYGPNGRGKSFMLESLKEHFDKIRQDSYHYDVRTSVIERPWRDGDTEENLMAIESAFDSAMEGNCRSNCHTTIFINGLDRLIDEDKNPGLCAKFLAYATNCSEYGTTWVGTVNSPQDCPDWLFNPTRTSKEVGVRSISDVETSALMSYFWAQKNRKDDSDHPKILNYMAENGIQLYPPQFKKIAEKVDEKLEKEKDYNSDKRGRYREPVKTQDVIAGIQQFMGFNKALFDNRVPSGLSDKEYLAIVKEKFNENK